MSFSAGKAMVYGSIAIDRLLGWLFLSKPAREFCIRYEAAIWTKWLMTY